MRAEESLRANYGIDLGGSGGLLLDSLEQNVSKALGLGGQEQEKGPNQLAVNPEQIRGMMADLAGKPYAGVNSIV
ncbi:MAG: hypothetical protein WC529_08050 [Candidatus Margulisiibacteriota bacterium]